eukprot:TRINITY_DN1721_c0_g1_i2.p1 TRINITY_DN1721_c0_g1~~TRINITY_DN1721_c0_g1_i2.p1  ORF type:complete len:351 (+),score=137.60 TRINITY_DN1721_c0_g1_i2:164-1216(+)
MNLMKMLSKVMTQLLNWTQKNEEIFLKRSACHFKLENFDKSLEDGNQVLKLNSKNEKGHLRVGMALFQLGKFKEAKNHFDSCLAIDSNHSQAKTWARKCGAELGPENSFSTASTSATDASLPTPSTSTTTTTTPSVPSSNPEPKQTVGAPEEKPQFTQSGTLKIRHEWYQTPTHVTVSVLCKNVKKEDAKIQIKERSLLVELSLPTGAEYQLDLQLEGSVDPNNTKISFLSTRIEIAMPKLKLLHWKNLEGSGDQTEYSNAQSSSSTTSSHKPKKNWDKILEDDKDEEQDINQVFQSIFANGTDEQKKAMMKSFTESGGTVLSTNWDEVGSKTVKGSPPAGMEMHSWNEK